MKTVIYIIRHAKSVANENGLFGGITDYDLSKVGQQQAEILAARLKEYEIDNIYSSPLKRAIQTISPTAIIKNKKVNIVDDLREINVGTWENVMRDELRKKFPKENMYIDQTEYYCGMEGQEETVHVSDRMFNCILKIARENIGNSIIITTHLVAIRAFLCKILDIPFEKTKEKIGHLENTSVTKLIYDSKTNKFEVIELNNMN